MIIKAVLIYFGTETWTKYGPLLLDYKGNACTLVPACTNQYSHTSRRYVHLAHVRFYDKLVIKIIFCTLSQTREVIQNKIRRILRNF